MAMVQSFIAFLGRAMLSIIFISSGIHKFVDWQGTMQLFNQTLTDSLATSIGTPYLQNLLEWALANSFPVLLAGALFEVIGGLLVFLGIWTRLGALLLILFMIPVTTLFHHFWDLQDPERQIQMIHFMKNVSIAGGLLFLAAVGKGCKKSAGDDKKSP